MAHYQQTEPFPGAASHGVTRTVDAMATVPIIVMDGEWEDRHEAWLGFGDRLGIACGCEDCAEAIYEILSACAKRNGEEGLP